MKGKVHMWGFVFSCALLLGFPAVTFTLRQVYQSAQSYTSPHSTTFSLLHLSLVTLYKVKMGKINSPLKRVFIGFNSFFAVSGNFGVSDFISVCVVFLTFGGGGGWKKKRWKKDFQLLLALVCLKRNTLRPRNKPNKKQTGQGHFKEKKTAFFFLYLM